MLWAPTCSYLKQMASIPNEQHCAARSAENEPPCSWMYSGDDFNCADSIAGDARGHCDAPGGVIAAIAPPVHGFTD